VILQGSQIVCERARDLSEDAREEPSDAAEKSGMFILLLHFQDRRRLDQRIQVNLPLS